MTSSGNETTALLAGDSQPRYLLESNIAYRRHRKIRQFQCCICTILLCAVVMIVVVVIAYGTNQDATDIISSNNSGENNTALLLALSWPISDAKQKSLCMNDYYDWQNALAAGKQALYELDEMENRLPILDADSPSYKHQKSFVTSKKSKLLSRVGYIQENAQKYIHRYTNETPTYTACNNIQNKWKDEFYTNNSIKCSKFQKYRSYDGTCNNLNHPLDFGVAFTPFRRVIPADYADGISKPRMAKDGTKLPSARTVSVIVHRPIYRNDDKFTVMLAVWGQFLDHDLTATALTQGKQGQTIKCCLKDVHPECFPVEIDHNDPYYSDYNITCLEFVRSAIASTDYLGPREQLNQATAFIDGSAVYGPSSNVTNTLRDFQNGKLKVYVTSDNRTLLPISTDPTDGCNREEQNKIGRYCFLTGDQRANENLHLTTMHLIWVRQHNNLASQLRNINPHWRNEQIFQEARKILIAQMQHITYNEFLKILVGSKLLIKSDVYPKKIGYYEGYDIDLNPSIANSFAAAAFRFGHTLIPALIRVLNDNSSNPDNIQFHKMLFNPYSLYQSDGLDKSLRSAMNTTIEASDTYFNSQLKKHLFQNTNENSKSSAVCGLDLVSLNIQRGRDHGIPGYSSWREHCGLRRPRNFSQLVGEIDSDSLTRIQVIYRHVDDIDLYTGAISEKPLNGGILGPTFTCLILDQFVRLKRGDRMWYENSNSPQSFTPEQLQQIRVTSLAHVICDNSDNLGHVQPHVMQRVGEGNEYTPCVAIPRPDLTKWKDADLSRVHFVDNSMSVKPVANAFVRV